MEPNGDNADSDNKRDSYDPHRDPLPKSKFGIFEPIFNFLLEILDNLKIIRGSDLKLALLLFILYYGCFVFLAICKNFSSNLCVLGLIIPLILGALFIIFYQWNRIRSIPQRELAEALDDFRLHTFKKSLPKGKRPKRSTSRFQR